MADHLLPTCTDGDCGGVCEDGWHDLDASPATAHMFIFPPMLGGLGRLFSTHPSMESRIANLETCRGQVA